VINKNYYVFVEYSSKEASFRKQLELMEFVRNNYDTNNDSDVLNTMNHFAISIQQAYFSKKLRSEYKHCANLFNTLNNYTTIHSNIPMFVDRHDYINNQYKQCIGVLTNKQNLQTIALFVNALNRFCSQSFDIIVKKLTPQTLLTAWLIVSFPEFILEVGREELHTNSNIYPNEIYFIALEAINVIKMIGLLDTFTNEFKRVLVKRINIYCNAINYYLVRDRGEMTKKLVTEWLEIHSTLKLIKTSKLYVSEDERRACFMQVAQTKFKVMENIKKISPEIKEDELKLYAKMLDRVAIMGKQNEKKMLYDDIKNNKFVLVKQILTELHDTIIKLSHRLQTEVNEFIDADFITGYAKIFTKDDITKYGTYFITILNKLGSENSEEIRIAKWNTIKEKYTNNDVDMCSYFTKMLIFVMMELYEIKQHILNTYIMMSLGVNSFITNSHIHSGR
jgi:hypothetical protein